MKNIFNQIKKIVARVTIENSFNTLTNKDEKINKEDNNKNKNTIIISKYYEFIFKEEGMSIVEIKLQAKRNYLIETKKKDEIKSR